MDYTTLTKTELKTILDEREIEYTTSDNKDDLIALAVGSDTLEDELGDELVDIPEAVIEPEPEVEVIPDPGPVVKAAPTVGTKKVLVTQVIGKVPLDNRAIICYGAGLKVIVPLGQVITLPAAAVATIDAEPRYEVSEQK